MTKSREKNKMCWNCDEEYSTYRDHQGLPFCSIKCEGNYYRWLNRFLS